MKIPNMCKLSTEYKRIEFRKAHVGSAEWSSFACCMKFDCVAMVWDEAAVGSLPCCVRLFEEDQ